MTRTVVEQITQAGVQKLRFSGTAPGRYLTRAALAGAFIFVGALLSSLCAAWFYDTNLPLAKLLGALAFSAALTLIVLLGGELFTGCTLVMSVSLYDGRVRLAGTLRVWALAYLGNLLGILVLCLLLAGVLGAVIGLDREYRAKEAGFRTHFLVALGSALFMIVSQYGFSGVLAGADVKLDPSRVAAQVVSGIGFLGGLCYNLLDFLNKISLI